MGTSLSAQFIDILDEFSDGGDLVTGIFLLVFTGQPEA